MISKKLTSFIALAFLVSSCQNNPPTSNEVTTSPPPQASESPPPQASESPPPQASVNPSESPSSETAANSETPNEIFSGELEKISFKCGDPVDFKSLKISGECPKDEEKDGRPHGDNFKVQIYNPTEKDVYLTEASIGQFDAKSSYITKILKPKQTLNRTLSLNEIDWPNKTFNLILGTGKVDISALDNNLNNMGKLEISPDPTDTFTAPLSCGQRVGETTIIKKFGVEYNLTCDPQQTSIKINNKAAEIRTVTVKYNSEGVDTSWIYPFINAGYNGIQSTLPTNGQYEISIMIPKPINQSQNP